MTAISKNNKKIERDLCLSQRYKWTVSPLPVDILLGENNILVSDIQTRIAHKKIFVKLLLISFTSFIRLCYYYIRQFFITTSATAVNHLVIDTGRGYEFNKIENIFHINRNEIDFISAFNLQNYAKYQRIEFIPLVRALIDSIDDYMVLFKIYNSERFLECIFKHVGKNIATYAYLRSFFLSLIDKNKNCIIYTSGAMLPAHAAISSGFKVINLYHGLMDKISLHSFPEYHSIYIYSDYEKNYLYKLRVKSELHIYPFLPVINKSNNIIVFMADHIKKIEFEVLFDMIKLFESFKYKVYIKTHPLNNASDLFMKDYNLKRYNPYDLFDVSKLHIIDNGLAADLIKEVKPNFVVGWDSTSLCEALNMSIIPINITNVDTNKNKLLEVYSHTKNALVWPADKGLILDFLAKKVSSEEMENFIRLK